MSKYIFITSNFELQEVDMTNSKTITALEAKSKGIRPPNWCTWEEIDTDLEILYYENEDDINNIHIYRDYGWEDELTCCKYKKYIYNVMCSNDKKRAEQILNYIREINLKGSIYICSIWAGDKVDIVPKEIYINSLSINDILSILDNFNKCIKVLPN